MWHAVRFITRVTCHLPLVALILLAGCEEPTVLLPKSYAEIPGWHQDRQSEAYRLFVDSCKASESRVLPYQTRRHEPIGDFDRWSEVCSAAYGFPNPTDAEARTFFEQKFEPFQVTTESKPLGQITGYYEPLLYGSMVRQGKFQTPAYGVPDNLTPGIPYMTREQIESRGLEGHAKPLLYVDDPVMLFFLHIQGSGKVRLPDGALVTLQYAAQNGHPFVPIGRLLKESGDLEEASMQSIRDWLYANPDRARDVMNQNPSYIFFKLTSGEQMAKGAMGLPLTSLRSAAIDDDRAAYGVPTYIATEHFDFFTRDHQKLEQLFVSQDTGGALHGPNRIDMFFGRGEEAEWEAGHQNTRALVYWLLPKAPSPQEVSAVEPSATAAEDPRAVLPSAIPADVPPAE